MGILVRVQNLARKTAGMLRWYARAVLFSGGLLWVILVVLWKEAGTSWLGPLLGLVLLLGPGAAIWSFSGLMRSMAELEVAGDVRALVSDARADLGEVRAAGLIGGLMRGLWSLTRRKAELMEVTGKTLASLKMITPLGLLAVVLAGLAGAAIVAAAAFAAGVLVLR